MPRLFLSVLLLVATAATRSAAAGAPLPAITADNPVVVELYTSQGCSSCPPADAFVGELTQQDTLLPLSFHVDYWNYIGWTDPFSGPAQTQRQKDYAAAAHRRSIFTPQIVLDGRAILEGNNRDEVIAAIQSAAAAPKLSVTIERAADGTLDVVLPAVSGRDATVWLVLYDQRKETKVPRGENAGATVVNHNVVRAIRRLGTWSGAAVRLPVALGADAAGHDGCAVLVQAGKGGPILGAAAFDLATLAGS